MWWGSLVRDVTAQVHRCCTEPTQHSFPYSAIQQLTSIQHGFIRNFQQQAKLGIHRMSLFRVNSKKGCIEFAYVLEFSTSLGQSIQSWEEKFNSEIQNRSVLKHETKYRMIAAGSPLPVKTHFPVAVPRVLHQYLSPHLSLNLTWKWEHCINKISDILRLFQIWQHKVCN